MASSAVGRTAAIVALAVAAVVAVALLLSAAVIQLRRSPPSSRTPRQLVKGNQVVVGGVPVGSVHEIALGDHGHALVKFSVDSDYAPLREGTTAQIRSTSLSSVAGRQVQLDAAARRTPRPPPIPDGATHARVADTTSEVDLDQIFNTLSPQDHQRLQARHPGLRHLLLRASPTQANAGLQVPQPVPLDLAAGLRRADPRHPGASSGCSSTPRTSPARSPSAPPTSRCSSTTST